jgi:hypothetical protein
MGAGRENCGRHRACNQARARIDMSDKVIVSGIDIINEPDPWDVGMVTERLPAIELYDDGIEPDSEPDVRRERAA